MVEWNILCMSSDSVSLGISFFLHDSSKSSCLHFRVDQMSGSRFPYKLLWSSSLSTSYHDSKVQKSRINNCISNSRYNLYIQLAVVAGWQDQTIREEASTGSCFPRRNALRIVRWASNYTFAQFSSSHASRQISRPGLWFRALHICLQIILVSTFNSTWTLHRIIGWCLMILWFSDLFLYLALLHPRIEKLT